ncbi:MarR family winged helix-turn-helix transcriptional regulator [Streptomyces sp. NPDC054766]|uniref:MarR family winged helix-turn-helix transcriptional regulator n=1 Tax=Streptomyces rhizosphaerihabitans TaxID=1266770 RepID=UPI0021BF37A7|nr:MarR family transcriptional regulator [Streptomyces rhizosphaerihabitans]MCT9007337.1 MarR family transcriptional regulator [Streptomyces rhizosphaerihabitans]
MELLSVSLAAYYGDFTVAAASENLTASQGKTLNVLRRGPASMSALATTLTCDASNMTGIIDRLEKRGLVRREPRPSDRRVKNVVLTAEGERVIDVIRGKMHTTQAGLNRLDEQERDTLYTLLERAFVPQDAAARP